MGIDMELLRANLTEVIAHRIEWSGDNEFPFPGAYYNLAYAYEGQNSTVIPEDGKFSVEIPVSILGSEEADAVAYVNVTVTVTDVEPLHE